jgi:hypothetical protein
MDYDFTFVVTGVTIEDSEAVQTLFDRLDAVLARAGGQHLISVTSEGPNAVEAALTAAAAIKDCVPGIRVVRLDRDLVGICEISDRTNRSRQNVQQWVAGTRKTEHGPFPSPEGTAGRSQVWLWTEVNAWLTMHGMGDDVGYPTREEMSDIDFALAHAVSLKFETAHTLGFDDGRQEVLRAVQHQMATVVQMLTTGETRNQSGEHVVLLADQREPVEAVLKRVSHVGHGVLLATLTDQFVVGVLSEARRTTTGSDVVAIPSHYTVKEWLELVLDNPGASFTLGGMECDEPPPPVQQRLTVASAIAA